jgi:protein ImuA
MRESTHILSALRARLAKHAPDRAHTHAQGRANEASNALALGHAPLDDYLDGGLRRGQLHEIFAGEDEDGGAAAGFAAMLGILAQNTGKGGAKPLLWLRTEEAQRRSGRFHGTGFAELGGNPATILLATVPDTLALLRGAADALRCNGLGVVVVECWANPARLDLMASRRLTLAAEHSGVTALMVRPGGRPAPSTADTRWSVRAAPSRPLEANAPGPPVFDLTLLRRRAGPAGKSWQLEWNRDRHSFHEPTRTPQISGAPLSVPVGEQVENLRAISLSV